MFKFGALGLAAALVVSTAASAGTITLDLSGRDSGSYSSLSHSKTFSQTVGGETVKVKATAWTATPTYNYLGAVTGYTISDARIGAYAQGLGVSTDRNDSHTIDNSGSVDFIIFQFDQVVQAISGTFAPFADSDAAAAVGQFAGNAFTASLGLDGGSYSALTVLFGSILSIDNAAWPNPRKINPEDEQGNLLLVGAQFFQNGYLSLTDAFKFDDLKIKTVTAPVPVPEPADFGLFALGVAGLLIGRQGAKRAARSRNG